ncbi:unnamed protein product [Phytophthora lilii]|uniref:Unnamed protein product n=1 Tax=Phytophthora lilii TaxID=2077276 RepID=A0A9W6WJB1_9STRA|nr:unnamed protein product [Phytophthora lilii]
MAAAGDAEAVAPPASSAASTAPPTGPPRASSSADADTSGHVMATANVPVQAAAGDDEEEVTTAEFSVDLTDGQTWAINFYECAAEGDLECLEEILESGRVGVNDVDVDGFTALMVAAAEGHRDVVRALLRRGADVGVRTHELRSTALHFAAKVGCTAVVDCWNVNADTPLIWACIEGRAEAVKVLLKHGADVNMLNQYGATTLLCAVMIGEDPEQDAESDKRRAEILTMLLEKNGKLVNFQDREGSTAMHLAASCGYLECVKTLLAFGADITLRNAIGQTPLEEAQDSELRESGPCVEHLQGIWRQLEEEAAARMMAMLEMEEEAGKTASGAGTSSKKSKKKNKKAKRKAAAKQQQQQQQPEQGQSHDSNKPAELESVPSGKPIEVEPAEEEPSAEPDRDITTMNNITPEAKDDGAKDDEANDDEAKNDEAKNDEASSTSSDEDEATPTRDSIVSLGDEHSDDEAEEETSGAATSVNDEDTAQAVDSTPSAGVWTTVGKKHRSPVAAITNTSLKTNSSPKKEKMVLPPTTRRKSTTTSPPKSTPHTPRRKFNQRPGNTRDRNSTGGRMSLTPASTTSSTVEETPTSGAVAHISARTQEERWGKTSGFVSTSRTSRSIASSSLLNPNALTFRSLGLTSGSTNMSTGRLTWKQQRTSGHYQVAREARDRWVSKLRLSNENVAETLGYLACGLCGELVNDNLQCSGGLTIGTDEKASSPCTQLYCASCLESSAFRTAESTMFKCVRCHEVIAKDSMMRNSLAQAQAASLGLSMSNSTTNGAQDDSIRYSLEDMQHILEASEPRASAVDLRAFHLVPGADVSALSNGQLEVLESAHQRALAEIVEQRLANARALERLQMEEWLKMQRDVLQFAPR